MTLDWDKVRSAARDAGEHAANVCALASWIKQANSDGSVQADTVVAWGVQLRAAQTMAKQSLDAAVFAAGMVDVNTAVAPCLSRIDYLREQLSAKPTAEQYQDAGARIRELREANALLQEQLTALTSENARLTHRLLGDEGQDSIRRITEDRDRLNRRLIAADREKRRLRDMLESIRYTSHNGLAATPLDLPDGAGWPKPDPDDSPETPR